MKEKDHLSDVELDRIVVTALLNLREMKPEGYCTSCLGLMATAITLRLYEMVKAIGDKDVTEAWKRNFLDHVGEEFVRP